MPGDCFSNRTSFGLAAVQSSPVLHEAHDRISAWVGVIVLVTGLAQAVLGLLCRQHRESFLGDSRNRVKKSRYIPPSPPLLESF